MNLKTIAKDTYGVLGQRQEDGTLEMGDSACWTGHYIYLTGLYFPRASFFEIKWGAYVRHPAPMATNYKFGAYYKHPWDGVMSRDQLTGVIGGLIRQKNYRALFRMICHHSLRFFLFAYNTRPNGQDPTTSKWKLPDLTLFDFWALYLRGFGKASRIFWPILCLLDFHLVFGAVKVNLTNDDDQINYALKLMISREFVPTPISWLAQKTVNLKTLHFLIHTYWCGWRQQPRMYDLFRDKMEQLGIKE